MTNTHVTTDLTNNIQTRLKSIIVDILAVLDFKIEYTNMPCELHNCAKLIAQYINDDNNIRLSNPSKIGVNECGDYYDGDLYNPISIILDYPKENILLGITIFSKNRKYTGINVYEYKIEKTIA